MERQIPKNVRQIGNVSDSPKIFWDLSFHAVYPP